MLLIVSHFIVCILSSFARQGFMIHSRRGADQKLLASEDGLLYSDGKIFHLVSFYQMLFCFLNNCN